jgi:hypothetical protein
MQGENAAPAVVICICSIEPKNHLFVIGHSNSVEDLENMDTFLVTTFDLAVLYRPPPPADATPLAHLP